MIKTYLCTFHCPKRNQSVQLTIQNKMGGTNLDHIEYQFVASCTINGNALKCIKYEDECPAIILAKDKRLCLEQM